MFTVIKVIATNNDSIDQAIMIPICSRFKIQLQWCIRSI